MTTITAKIGNGATYCNMSNMGVGIVAPGVMTCTASSAITTGSTIVFYIPLINGLTVKTVVPFINAPTAGTVTNAAPFSAVAIANVTNSAGTVVEQTVTLTLGTGPLTEGDEIGILVFYGV